jgi:orotate phosphoribosyltransferase
VPPALLSLLAARRGHFQLESGHHGALWLDLDALFARPEAVRPFTDRLAELLTPYHADAICGPQLGGAVVARMVAERLGVASFETERGKTTAPGSLYAAEYRVRPADLPRIQGKRVAVVDDAISAGSSVRATLKEIRAHGADPVAVGCLLRMGDTGVHALAGEGLPIEAVDVTRYEVWVPAACPLCAAGVTLTPVPSP